jgi:hypothetical protein
VTEGSDVIGVDHAVLAVEYEVAMFCRLRATGVLTPDRLGSDIFLILEFRSVSGTIPGL